MRVVAMATPCAAAGCWSRDTETIAGVTLCGAHLAGLRAELAPPPPLAVFAPSFEDVDVAVYYATFDRGLTVKIGWSAAPGVRLREMSTGGRRGPARLLAARPGGAEVETVVHRRFRHLQVAERGSAREFFRLDDEMHGHLRRVHERWPDWRAMVKALDARQAPPRRRQSRAV